MTVAAELAVCAWVNQMSDLTGTTGTPGPLAQGAFTIVQHPGRRWGVRAGHPIAGPYSGWSPRPGDLDCATIVQRDFDDRSG